ncbi:hypothetical protein, partial [Photobacterium damselae]|uniref:hypothetical protein n=1 Tax=Photobacterium damselae TaxID=38293 RepID=UPI001C6386DF
IFNLEPLDLQIVALPVNQIILAEPRILRLLGYIHLIAHNLQNNIRASIQIFLLFTLGNRLHL